MSSKPLSLTSLDLATTHLTKAVRSARIAEAFAAPGHDMAEQIPQYAGAAADGIGNALNILQQLGGTATHLPQPEPIPLDKLDTPDVRALRDGLRALLPIAERVDASRGRALPPSMDVPPGASRGHDVADSLAMFVARLDMEIKGPVGRE